MATRRFSRVWSSASIGIDALPIQIETFIAPGLPKHTVVGLPRGAVREGLDRIRAAVHSSGLKVPRGAITVNLAPADVRKEGTAFDLPVAISVLSADGGVRWSLDPDRVVIVGELALDGGLRPVRGVLSAALQARADGREAFIVPIANAREAAVVPDLTILPVTSLKHALSVVEGTGKPYATLPETDDNRPDRTVTGELDFAEVSGQHHARRALEIAAAGGHNVLMVGPPGSGKTMLARRLPSILPPLEREEAVETTRIQSVAGGCPASGLVRIRPFRAPHHTISDAGLVGGGSPPGPGEITLAHHGVLFLDELPEFRRNVLESLRQPMEDGFIVLSRAEFHIRYPARFMLVAAMNPCPCGYYGSERACACLPGALQRYRNRISGPLLDRIDLQLDVRALPAEALSVRLSPGESSSAMRRRVTAARELQIHRFENAPGLMFNRDIPPGRFERYLMPDAGVRPFLRMASRKLALTARSFHRALRVARTIADLENELKVSERSVSEALQYRTSFS